MTDQKSSDTINISIGRNAAPWLKDFILSSMPPDIQHVNLHDHSQNPPDSQPKRPEAKPWALTESQALQKKRECMGHLVDAEPMPFIQLDGWIDQSKLDCVFNADEDRDSMLGSCSYDLRHMPSDLAIRIMIHADTDRNTTIRVLQKQLKWLENMDANSFERMKPHAPTEDQDSENIPF